MQKKNAKLFSIPGNSEPKLNSWFPFRGQGFLILIAIVIATVQHANKTTEQGNNIEKLAAGMKGIKEHLPPNSSITLKMPEGAPDAGYMWWRYILAPRYCSIHPKEKLDTVLAILNINANDSVAGSVTGNRKIIYSSNDGQFKYFLTCNNK